MIQTILLFMYSALRESILSLLRSYSRMAFQVPSPEHFLNPHY